MNRKHFLAPVTLGVLLAFPAPAWPGQGDDHVAGGWRQLDAMDENKLVYEVDPGRVETCPRLRRRQGSRILRKLKAAIRWKPCRPQARHLRQGSEQGHVPVGVEQCVQVTVNKPGGISHGEFDNGFGKPCYALIQVVHNFGAAAVLGGRYSRCGHLPHGIRSHVRLADPSCLGRANRQRRIVRYHQPLLLRRDAGLSRIAMAPSQSRWSRHVRLPAGRRLSHPRQRWNDASVSVASRVWLR